MRIHFFVIAIILFLFSCQTKNAEKQSFRIIGLRNDFNTETEDELFIIEDSDIVCVDWSNQSFKISQAAINAIKQKKLFTGGFINEYLKLEFNGRELTTVNIHNPGSSTRYHAKGSPSAYIFLSTNTIFSSDGWLIISPINLKNGSVYDSLYIDSVFTFFKSKGLLRSRFWDCSSNTSNDSIFNSPNKNFAKDLAQKFDKEIIW